MIATPVAGLRPFCKACGWRKGGQDSWNGTACKCGHSEPPIQAVEERSTSVDYQARRCKHGDDLAATRRTDL